MSHIGRFPEFPLAEKDAHETYGESGDGGGGVEQVVRTRPHWARKVRRDRAGVVPATRLMECAGLLRLRATEDGISTNCGNDAMIQPCGVSYFIPMGATVRDMAEGLAARLSHTDIRSIRGFGSLSTETVVYCSSPTGFGNAYRSISVQWPNPKLGVHRAAWVVGEEPRWGTEHPKPASLATLSLVEKRDLLFFSPHAQRLEKHLLV